MTQGFLPGRAWGRGGRRANKSSVASCVFSTQILYHRTKGCWGVGGAVIHWLHPSWPERHPSSSLAPRDGVSQTIKAFRSGSTTPDLTMVLGRCEVAGAVWVGSSWDQDPQIVGFQSLHYSVSPRVRNSMPDLPCPASGHEAHLCVCLFLPVKRDLSLPLHAL